jgi:hypothetical protein
MRSTFLRSAAIATLVVAAGLMAAPIPSNAQNIQVALTPDTTLVNPGDQFDIDITVTQSGLAFNGFDAVIGWDSTAVTQLTSNEGTLMKNACANTFYRLRTGAGIDSITDVLLCSGVSVTGPGQIYHMHFQASQTPQTTQITFLPGLQFYNDGLFVGPAISSDATVIIVTPVGVGARPSPGRLRLTAAPNPGRGGTTLTVEADRAGAQELRVVDARGHLVRCFRSWASAPGARAFVWDGRDSQGRSAPPGVYLATFEVSGRTVSSRICLIR